VRALRLIVRRSIFKVWLLGVLGLPLIFIAVDYVWGTFGFLDLFGSWSYGSKEVEAFEPRDDVLVAILGSLGIACTGFTIKEVVAPRRLLAADDDGVHVPLRGPLRRPHGISWYQVKELRAEDDALLIEVQSRGDLPEDPWGARWVEERVLRIPSAWWDRTPESAIGRIQALGFRPLLVSAPVADEQLLAAIDEAHAAGVQLGAGAAEATGPHPFVAADAAPPIEPEHQPDEPAPASDAPFTESDSAVDAELDRALGQLLDQDEDE
jgi:hypothetical protein